MHSRADRATCLIHTAGPNGRATRPYPDCPLDYTAYADN